MAEQKENSVLFSLKELMNLEEERIKQEVAARSLGVALRKLESLIAAAAQEWHHSEGC